MRPFSKSTYIFQHGILITVGLFGGEAKFSLPNLVLKQQKMQGVLIGSLDMMKERGQDGQSAIFTATV